jgi:hypothetical protein
MRDMGTVTYSRGEEAVSEEFFENPLRIVDTAVRTPIDDALLAPILLSASGTGGESMSADPRVDRLTSTALTVDYSTDSTRSVANSIDEAYGFADAATDRNAVLHSHRHHKINETKNKQEAVM